MLIVPPKIAKYDK